LTLLYVVAGEASGDVLGARLIAALRRARPGLEFAGIGGERMAERGFFSLFPMRELSLMGLVEVLPKLRGLARRMAETEADILRRQPALLVTIDAPSFTLRLAGRVRPRGVRVVHYVAPQVWAWRPGRVRKLVGRIDRLLTLLPFEPAFFAAAGIPAEFVGHPVLESGADAGNAARFRARHGVAPDDILVVVMPGSRAGEVARLGAIFGQALELARQALPTLRPVVPVVPQVAAAVRGLVATWPGAPILVESIADKHDAFAAAAAGLIKSGTSSLELAVAGVPHVVAYRVNPVTAAIVRRIVKVPHASLVNLLCERTVVPELLQERCTPPALAASLLEVLADPKPQRGGFAEALARLRPAAGTPSEAAATAILAMLES